MEFVIKSLLLWHTCATIVKDQFNTGEPQVTTEVWLVPSGKRELTEPEKFLSQIYTNGWDLSFVLNV